jgi:type IV pilus assembly protein PilM
MIWRPGTTRTPIGLDLGGRYLNAVQLDHGGAPWRLAAATSVRRPEGDVPLTTEELARFAAVLERQGFRGRRVVVAVPCRQLLSSVLELPPADSGAPLQEIARSELASAHACPEESIEIATWSLPEAGPRAAGSRSMAVACRRDDADTLLDALEGAGFQVEALDVACWALWRAVRQRAAEQPVTATLSIDWHGSHVVVMSPDTVLFERALPDLGLCRLHSGFVDELGLDVEVTDYVLSEVGLGHALPDGVEEDLVVTGRARLATFVERLVTEARLSLEYSGRESAGDALGELYIVGEGAMIRDLGPHFAEAIGHPVEVLRPDIIGSAKGARTSNESRLMMALGLAMHAGGRSS